MALQLHNFPSDLISSHQEMHPPLFKAIAANDKQTFLSHFDTTCKEYEITAKNKNSVLHLASRFGHFELVSEIVKLCPDLVEAGNKNKDTPLHEACRHGHANVAMLLLETNPWAACLLNRHSQSALFVACSSGHLSIVKLLLNQQWLIDFEEDEEDLSSLHAAISRGHTEIIRRLLEVGPNLAHKADQNGSFPLHCACTKEHLEITRMLLKLDPGLAMKYDGNGYTPLHLAAMKGTVKILKEFLHYDPSCFILLTRDEETVFHLAVRYKRYEAFVYLAQVFHDTSVLHSPDRFGNTVLHLAVSTGLSSFADYIINTVRVDINYRNERGLTALDILEQATRTTSEMQGIKEMLQRASGREMIEQPPDAVTEREKDSSLESPIVVFNLQTEENELMNNDPVEHLAASEKDSNNASEHEVEEVAASENGTANNSPSRLQRNKLMSDRHREELGELYRARRDKQSQIYMEALQNARNTIILVAILIATVTFTAGTTPPGGVYQEGPLKGKSTVGKTTAFKVFTISNNIALFSSLCLVIVLVSIIPFRRKPLVRLLVIAHKVMWVAVSFMATAFVAAMWITLPQGRGEFWTIGVLLSISAGTMGFVFLYLGVALARHWATKLKWRKGKHGEDKATMGDVTMSESCNSDVHSGILMGLGYHVY